MPIRFGLFLAVLVTALSGIGWLRSALGRIKVARKVPSTVRWISCPCISRCAITRSA